jgi:hypothetical protein
MLQVLYQPPDVSYPSAAAEILAARNAAIQEGLAFDRALATQQGRVQGQKYKVAILSTCQTCCLAANLLAARNAAIQEELASGQALALQQGGASSRALTRLRCHPAS